MKNIAILFLAVVLAQGLFVSVTNAGESTAESSHSPEVVFDTTMGSFTVELDLVKAPKTVANFLSYVDDGFYDNTLFHRVIPRFVVQGGGFEAGMTRKRTRSPVENESENGLQNVRGTVSMARRSDPDSARSQFFINLKHNLTLDSRRKKPGYTVFGKVTEGMEVIDKIAAVPTKTVGSMKKVPKQDIVVLSAKRKHQILVREDATESKVSNQEPERETEVGEQEGFEPGVHYIVLDDPVPTRDASRIEVVTMFSYACPHCFEFEPMIEAWTKQQDSDIDSWRFPAVWNEPMELYARAFFAARGLGVADKTHSALFSAIVSEHQKLSNEEELSDFFAKYGVEKDAFTKAFNSEAVKTEVERAEALVRSYKPVGVPEVVVNGKYRIDRMRAGGLKEIVAVVDFLVEQERGALSTGN